MPAYQTTPFKPSPQLLVSGTPSYVFGSFNDRTSPTLGNILTDAAVTTVATVVFQIRQGNIPLVGSKVSVRGAANSVNFNVTNATVLTVSCTDAGVCTVTYTISSTSQGVTADAGEVEIPQSEIGEAAANGASVPVAAPFNSGNPNNTKLISADVRFDGTAQALVVLQAANFDLDSEYVTLGTVYSTSVLSSAEFESNFRFYRLFVSGLTGSGNIVGKIEL